MLYFDSTPAAAAPPPGPAPALPAGGDKPSRASGAFGDLLSRLTGQPADRIDKKGAQAAAARARKDAPAGVPFAFTPAPTGQRTSASAAGPKAPGPAAGAAPAAPDSHANDENALADHLAWLLAMASAPATPDAPAPAPTTFAGDATGAKATDATSCTAQTAPGGGAAQASKLLTVQELLAAAAGLDGAQGVQGVRSSQGAEGAEGAQAAQRAQASRSALELPGVHPRQAPPGATAPNAAALAVAASADGAPPADANGPSPLAAALKNAGLPVQADAVPAARAGEAAAAANGDQSKTSAAAAVPASAATFAPVQAAETRSGDGGGPSRRDARASDERPIDSTLSKTAAAPQTAQVFLMPADVRVQSGAAPAGADAVAPARTEIPADADVPRQIVQAIRLQWADGVGDARIRLQPEYMGDLSISIRVEHGSVTASLESNNASVREWVDNNQPMLRQALSEHGLHLDRLTITEEQAAPDWNGNEQPEQKQRQEDARQAQRARRRDDANSPVFEVIA